MSTIIEILAGILFICLAVPTGLIFLAHWIINFVLNLFYSGMASIIQVLGLYAKWVKIEYKDGKPIIRYFKK